MWFYGGPSSIALWKARGRLPIRDNWTFFDSSYDWDVISRYWSKSALFRGGWVTLSANFRWKGTSPPTIVGIRKLECFCYFTEKQYDPLFIPLDRVPACNRQRDGRTDRITVDILQRSALQAMRPHVKNSSQYQTHVCSSLRYPPGSSVMWGGRADRHRQ